MNKLLIILLLGLGSCGVETYSGVTETETKRFIITSNTVVVDGNINKIVYVIKDNNTEKEYIGFVNSYGPVPLLEIK